MNLKILSGTANPLLAENIAEAIGVRRSRVLLDRFPDSELHVEIQESVRGADVYIVQPAEKRFGCSKSWERSATRKRWSLTI